MKIYTKTGDDGQTGLWAGERISKDHVQVDAYGSVDELNSCLGVVLTHDIPSEVAQLLATIQNRLFDLGGQLSTSQGKKPACGVIEDDIVELERAIDAFEEELPTLKNFILPGGVPAAAALHVARSVCRRAERRCVSWARISDGSPTLPVKYLNRLSDFLFVAARFVNHKAAESDVVWHPRETE